ncbi:glycosyltransferase [Streptomyces sp. NPDC057694]|uniref:glycosyltransferase n=1 Tax=Streptomyces sp. NPDC057694 TaxID=3346216 RepID=UPI0036CB502C
MRILFSSTPAHGHLLPQLPLARAFRDRGDDVAVLTAASYASLVAAERFELLAAGPEMPVLLAESLRRTGADAATEPTPEAVAELFAGVRIDLSADEAVAAARGFRPDLIVSEATDFVGPFVAAALDVPLAKLALGPHLPDEFSEVFDSVAEARHKKHGLAVPTPLWHLDPCPQLLQTPGWQQPQGWTPLRPEAHRGPDTPEHVGTAAPGAAPAAGSRPKALLSFGTHFAQPEVLRPLVKALAPTVDVLATLALTATDENVGSDLDHVEVTRFAPLAELLDGIAVVVTHGGAGTTLGTLARGLPLVVVPQGADQFLQAAAVTSSGTGIAVLPPANDPEMVAKAVAEVLGNPEYRDNALRAAAQIAAMPSPREIADRLADELS